MIPLLGFVALAVDSGLIYSARAALQTAADAASLAGVRPLAACNSGAAERAAALAAAQGSVTANPVVGRALTVAGGDVTVGKATGAARTFTATNANPDSVQVAVHEDAVRNGPLALSAGVVLGRPTAALDAWSVATRDRHLTGFKVPAGGKGRIIPVAASAARFGAAGTNVVLAESQSGNGNWGLIDLTATGFTTSFHSNTPTLIDQIDNGFHGTLTFDPGAGTPDSGKTGNLGNGLDTAFSTRIGDIVLVATYTAQPTGSGTNQTYRINGFAALKITSVQGGHGGGVFGTVATLTDDTIVTDPAAAENCFISKVQLTR
jgi:hypothetical protein